MSKIKRDYDSSDGSNPPPGYADTPVQGQIGLLKPCLQSCDLYIGIDKSGSMQCDCKGYFPPKEHHTSRWDQLRGAVSQLAPYITDVDRDGIDLFFIESAMQDPTRCTTAQSVENALDKRGGPGGTTPTGRTLWNQLKPYLDDLRHLLPDKQRVEGEIAKIKQDIRERGKAYSSSSDLEKRLEDYNKELARTKPRNYILITDGTAGEYYLCHR
ncbi:hypothetical protein C8R43DRAFT_1039533 [Mycena crocata]|nr:hypothetical protein C8R43DRAFT_1039533 [Mycena crocata]